MCSYYSTGLHFSHFFFNDTATTEIYTLSLHDALPISLRHTGADGADRLRVEVKLCAEYFQSAVQLRRRFAEQTLPRSEEHTSNSSHVSISYAVFCLKKKTNSTSSHSTTAHLTHVIPSA